MSFGIILLVIAGFVGGFTAAFGCIWFGTFLWTEGDKVQSLMVYALGLIVTFLVVGLAFIAMAKGIVG